ncbi:DUF4190 domain-containing protein [Saccharopolyspora hordei]|uniref:Tetrahydromethanopterin S-methyltransferase subunit B n=1 Tax=Saccharopolyspora hordei TaxID=1838 RepID=A0A853ATR4_9PSEU|nr:DUF4190 domain-containing protein [Saccharopolyspora hordei]NYI86043.1 tetrahydromethanopterin S-methyltransferase subunit B [Saccharopolyspora hordei]
MTYPYDPNHPPVLGYPPRNNGLAIASLCVSLAAIMTCYGALLVGPVGAVLGHVSLREIKRAPHLYHNRSMALAGIIIGWSVFALWALLITFVIMAATGVLGPDLESAFND